MVKRTILFILSSCLLFSCMSGSATPASTSVVDVHATSAAQPWLTELFECANQQGVVLNVSAGGAQIELRVGEPEILLAPAFQIDEEEILIVTHRESSIQNLSPEEAQALFAGQGDPSAQVWVYASGEEVQVLFDQLVMKGRSVSSSARVAANPQEMSDILNTEKNSVGILPRHWMAGTVRDVYSAGTVPVLAIQNGDENETSRTLLACLSQ
jgi:hypothetical protein